MFDELLYLRSGATDWTSGDLATGASEVLGETGISLEGTPMKGMAAVVIFPQALVDDGTDSVEATDYAEVRIQHSESLGSGYEDLVIFPQQINTSVARRVIRRFATTKRYVRAAVEFYNTTKSVDCALDLGEVIVLIGDEDFDNIPSK